MSDRAADELRYAESRRVVLSQHEETRTVLLRFPFATLIQKA